MSKFNVGGGFEFVFRNSLEMTPRGEAVFPIAQTTAIFGVEAAHLTTLGGGTFVGDAFQKLVFIPINLANNRRFVSS